MRAAARRTPRAAAPARLTTSSVIAVAGIFSRSARTADTAPAAADETDQVQSFGRGDFRLDFGERIFQRQVQAVEELIGPLEDADVRGAKTGSFESDQIEALGFDLETGVG